MKVEMDLDVEISDAFEEICKESNKTPSEIFNSFIKSLHDAWHSASGRDWFGDATFDQVLDCILNNLNVGPKIIEDTAKGFLIQDHIKSKIDRLEVDFEKKSFWYELKNTENKYDLIFIKVDIADDQISISRMSAVSVPAVAVQDLHKRIIDASDFANKFINDINAEEYSQATNRSVKLKIISADMTPCFVSITLTVTAANRKYLPTLDTLNLLLREISNIVWRNLQML